jgi:hypothetical protein
VGEQLCKLGYIEADASELADAGADWHFVKALLCGGCDRSTAARIAR